MVADPKPSSLEAVIQPEKFSAEDLRHQVMSLCIATDGKNPSEPQSKRRKVTEEPRSLLRVISAIYDIFRIEPEADLTALDDVLQYVFHSRA